MLLIRYPAVINEKLTYGVHDQLHASILQLMIARADLVKVKIVVDAGADVNLEVENETALNAAIQVGSLPIVEYLLSHGVDVRQVLSQTKRNLVQEALLQRKPEIASRLVQAGLPLDIFSQCGLGMIDTTWTCRVAVGPQCKT